ncbi:hypothetical protein B0H14DRAFT_2591329 [Mycena olivaceomarginata]|nr:hypothetical protein B0H14DRAFT_2591329 [Mycena olivaceomarginata]
MPSRHRGVARNKKKKERIAIVAKRQGERAGGRIGFLRIPSLPALPALAALPQSESLCPESLSLSLPLPLGEAREREEEACEEYDHRWRGALAPHVGAGAGAGAGSGGAGAGEITNTPSTGEEAGAGVQGEWGARRERDSTASASLNCDARGRGCQPVYRPGPAIGAEAARVDANAGLGSGRGKGGKLHFSSAGDRGEEGEDGRHTRPAATAARPRTRRRRRRHTPLTRPPPLPTQRRRRRRDALRLRWEAPLHLRGRSAGEGESSAASRSLESYDCCEEEGEGVPNGAYAVQSPLQGMLSASVGRGVFGGARVLERDKAGDGREAEAEAEAIETEGGIIADSRRSARDEARAADMGNGSQEGEAGKNGGSGGGRVMKLPAGHRLRRGRDRRHGALNDRERLDALAPNHRLPLQLRRDVVALRRGRRGQPARHGARGARPGSLRLARVAARKGRARARALVVRVQVQWSSVHRGVTWMSCDESSGRWLEPTQQRQGSVHRNRSSFQLGDFNAFISSIVFRKTFEQSKAVDTRPWTTCNCRLPIRSRVVHSAHARSEDRDDP